MRSQAQAQVDGGMQLTLLEFLSLERSRRRRAATAPAHTSAPPAAGAGMQMQDVLTTVSGKPITVEDTVLYLKATGNFRAIIYQLISIEVITQTARARNIHVPEAQLHASLRQRREALGLSDAITMNNHCKWLGITYEQWQKQIEIELLAERLKSKLFNEAALRQAYTENQREFRRFTFARIVVSSADPLAGIADDCRAGRISFAAAAEKFSQDEATRALGGRCGSWHWTDLSADLQQRVLHAQIGEIVGPLQEVNANWALYQVLAIQQLDYTAQLAGQIREFLFNEWLEREVRNAPA